MLKLLIPCLALLVLLRNKVEAHSTTTSSAVPTHIVSVGIEGLQFTPTELAANVSDVIEFRFYPQNHSVARAEYGSNRACIPYEVTGINKKGFWSGFHPINVVLNDPPKFQVVVNDTNPIFFYCSSPGACHEEGMIGVINANSTQTLANQLAYAKKSSLQFSPGENFPVEAEASLTSTTHPTSTSSPNQPPSTSSSPAAIVVTDPSPSSSPSKLSPGAIAGIVIGASALVVLASALLYLCGRQHTIKEILHHNSRPPNMSSHPHIHHPGGPNTPSYMPPSASLSETTYYSKPRHLMTENEIRGLGQFSGAGSENHSHLSDSHVGSEGYVRSRSRSPGADEYGMVIPTLNLEGTGSGTGVGAANGRGGSRSPSYQQGNTGGNGGGSLTNSPGIPGTLGVQVGVGESEKLRGLRPSPSPGPPNHFHSNTSSSGPHELATHQDQNGTRGYERTHTHTHERYDDPEIRITDQDHQGGNTFFWDEGESR
ncbi:predicted protein [Sclerotinia sclerotiorum 1980 UF-70]|uniref:Extracellular serine-rich protein n=2 Tax=Sclerotinia sclerotiorum (strain ATCC 18683 / 1980 / Ss-1) TaxID=665079 RepID=A7EH91_SCLS1|nr:predicted protein [Sclerotinia sclerotiorum 1980 UF-70]APA06724.1 hypothetical protein sscle_02g014940 [Sclerotinia sclerotiorum 1980 UF-70]EDO02207.1 predicted protein [Sclerotinia sclerotiorum 1980 UF-70]